MGGSKNKSAAQREKSQQDNGPKKSKKSEKNVAISKTKLAVNIDETKAGKYIKEAKVITVQDLARHTDVKISIANSFLLKSLKQGTVKRVCGFSGHHLYQLISGK